MDPKHVGKRAWVMTDATRLVGEHSAGLCRAAGRRLGPQRFSRQLTGRGFLGTRGAGVATILPEKLASASRTCTLTMSGLSGTTGQMLPGKR